MWSAVRFAVLAASLIAYAVVSATPRTMNDGVYSKAQAKNGEQLYQEHCLLCHDKKYHRPVLKNWEGRSLKSFFVMMRSSMPQNNAGVLRDREYVDILAYILSLSRYPSGDVELDYSNGAMDEIVISNRK